MNNAFSIVRHKTYSKVPNMPLQMKEDITVSKVWEEFGSLFNELSSSDDIDKEPNSGGVVLSKSFINVFGILDVKIRGFNKSLVFYFFDDSELV